MLRYSLCALFLACGTSLDDSAFAQKYGVLYAFGTNAQDGFLPYSNIARDGAGNLYGTTVAGGMSGGGTVFRLSPDGTETVLHGFERGTDGSTPNGVTIDQAGNVYGTTARGPMGSAGGSTCQCGVVFKIGPAGTETILHVFAGGADGAYPQGSVVLDGSGNVYGTTGYGGNRGGRDLGCGTVFKLAPRWERNYPVRFQGQ